MQTAVLIAFLTFLNPSTPTTAEEGRIQDLRIGDWLYGPRISHDDLIGKVVLLEYWGS